MKIRFCLCVVLCAGFLSAGSCLQAETLVSRGPASEASPAQEAQPDLEASGGEEAGEGGEYYEATEVLQVEVIALEGEAEVKPREGEYGPVKEGALLESGATIKTGSGASLEIGFDEADENIVRVEENTTVVLLLKEDEKIELLQGEVFSIINDLPGGASFEIRTPTAVTGARGTEWATRYKDETTDVEAFDDTPYVKSFDPKGRLRSKAVDVKPGFATSVRRFEQPAEATRISDTRRRQWHRKKQDLRKRVQDSRQKRGRPERDPKKMRRFKATIKKGDPRIQQMRERARGRSGGGDPKDVEGAPREGSGDFKERVERGDSWRERLKKHFGERAQKDPLSGGEEEPPRKPGDAGLKKGAGKEQVGKGEGAVRRPIGQVTKERSGRNMAPKKTRSAAPAVSPARR